VNEIARAVFTAWEFGWNVICGLRPAATRWHRIRGERMMRGAAFVANRMIAFAIRP